MKRKQSLEKKITTYSALAAGLLGLHPVANAQIKYHDVNPDTTLTGTDSFSLDINNDGTIDFMLHQRHILSGTLYGDGNSLYVRDTNQLLLSNSYLKVLNNNDRISQADTVWSNSIGTFLAKGIGPSGAFQYGNWTGGVTNKFAGFRFAIGGHWYYGWARFDVAADAKSITIKDWAYNNYTDGQILAGQQTSSVDPNLPGEELNISQENNMLYIRSKNDHTIDGLVRIINASGQVVYSGIINDDVVKIDISDLKPGLYIVNIRSKDIYYSRRIMLNP